MMLDHEQTINLICLAQNGDKEAKNTLLCENSPLIKSIIKRFIKKGVEYDDLFQLGSLGFLKAINNFDMSYNVKFSTYAVPMIIGEVKRFLRDDGTIKVSRSIKSLNIKINRFISEYTEINNEKPSIDTIAKHFEVDSQDIVFAMDSSKIPLSIYTPIEEDGNKQLFLVDRFIKQDEEDVLYDNLVLKDALKSLEQRDKKIILMRFFRDKTQSEIAKELGVSQVQVSRLENKILEKIRFKIKY